MFRNFLTFTNEVERTEVSDDEVGDGKLKWSAVEFNYHLFAFVLDKKTPARFIIKENGEMVIDVVEETNNFEGYSLLLKEYDSLVKLGDKLDLSVDFGILES